MNVIVTDCHFNEAEAARYLNKSLRWLQKQLKESDNPPPSFKLGKKKSAFQEE